MSTALKKSLRGVKVAFEQVLLHVVCRRDLDGLFIEPVDEGLKGFILSLHDDFLGRL